MIFGIKDYPDANQNQENLLIPKIMVQDKIEVTPTFFPILAAHLYMYSDIPGIQF